jgi:hypothetical protein
MARLTTAALIPPNLMRQSAHEAAGWRLDAARAVPPAFPFHTRTAR